MLDYIRSGAQSFWVKVAFGIIILVFVFWGVGNFNDRDYSNVVAVVNGEPIVAQEFERAYQGAEEYILRNNPGMTREQLIKDHLGRQVLRDMIQAVLMQQEARRAGIEITPLELRQAVGKVKAFQDEKGRFDPEAYKRLLAARRTSPARYEKELADQLLQEKVFALVTAPVWVDTQEALNRYNYLREQRIVDYLFVPAEKFIAQVKVPEAEISQWYEGHQANFAVPPMVDVSYISLAPEALVNKESFSAEAVKKWYDAHSSQFALPERARVSHILVEAPADADAGTDREAREKIEAAAKEYASGKKFSDLANEINGEGAAGPGGELGWIIRGQTVPQFEDAVFSTSSGEVAGPIRTPFGWHLILVEERLEAGVQPLAEVEQDVRLALAQEEGAEKLHDALDTLIEDNILEKPMQESAARYGLKVEKTGLLDAQALAQTLGIKPEDAQILLAAQPGVALETAFEAGNKYVIARIDSSVPATTRPLKEVSAEIEKIIQAEKALAMAREEGEQLLAKARDDQVKLDLQTSPPVERGGAIGDLGDDAAANAAIFTTPVGQWLPQVYTVTGKDGPGALIAKVEKILPPESGEFESVQEIMINGARQARQEAIYALFIQNLADKAKIEITNQNLVDRVSM